MCASLTSPWTEDGGFSQEENSLRRLTEVQDQPRCGFPATPLKSLGKLPKVAPPEGSSHTGSFQVGKCLKQTFNPPLPKTKKQLVRTLQASPSPATAAPFCFQAYRQRSFETEHGRNCVVLGQVT